MNILAEWTRVNAEWIEYPKHTLTTHTELIILFLCLLCKHLNIFGASYANIPSKLAPCTPPQLCLCPPSSSSSSNCCIHKSVIHPTNIFWKTKNCIEQFARRWVNNLFIAIPSPCNLYPCPVYVTGIPLITKGNDTNTCVCVCVYVHLVLLYTHTIKLQ